MNQYQHSKLKMGISTLACVRDPEHQPLWQGIVGFEDTVERLVEVIDGINAESLKQSKRTGSSAEKRAVKRSAITMAINIASALQAHAEATQNVRLAAQAQLSSSELTYMREADMVNRLQAVHALGTEYATVLSDTYDIKAADLAALQTAITAFTQVKVAPSQDRAARVSATAELSQLFRELGRVLNDRLDPLMVRFQASEPAFFNEYRSARTIIDPARESKPEEVGTATAPALKAA